MSLEGKHYSNPNGTWRRAILPALALCALGFPATFKHPLPQNPSPSPVAKSALAVPTSSAPTFELKPTQTPTPTRTRTTTPLPRATEAKRQALFSALITPLNRAASVVRAREKAKNPQSYSRQVEAKKEQAGTTLLLYVCGIDHEPPEVEAVLICSNSLFVLRPEGRIDTLTFTHDTRFPEQERAESISGKPGSARRSDRLWLNSLPIAERFRIMRQAYQNATGLPIDFIIAVQSDVAVADLIRTVFGKIKVNVPVGFTAHPVYVDAKTKLPERTFVAGEQEMTWEAVYQYIKAVPKAKKYPPALENNVRKHVVFKAMFAEIHRQKTNPLFWPPFLVNLTNLLRKQASSQNVVADFDLPGLVIDNIGAASSEMVRLGVAGQMPEIGAPVFGSEMYFVDPSTSFYPEPTVRWGALNSGDPFAIKDIGRGVYPEYYVEIPDWESICSAEPKPRDPCGADPYSSDLVQDYWLPVRQRTDEFLFQESVE